MSIQFRLQIYKKNAIPQSGMAIISTFTANLISAQRGT